MNEEGKSTAVKILRSQISRKHSSEASVSTNRERYSPMVDVGHEIHAMQVRTEFPGMPIPFAGSCFHVKIPGKGVVVVDVK